MGHIEPYGWKYIYENEATVDECKDMSGYSAQADFLYLIRTHIVQSEFY